MRITIDGQEVELEHGQSVLEGARKLGIDIPTLCHLEKCGSLTTCLVCLVKVNGRLIPSCGTQAVEGMIVESEIDEVHEARRTALELLFSDHVGDCLSPCHRLCPLQLNIPVMIRQIESGTLDAAAATIRQSLPLAAVLGRLCHHPCEQGCRRAPADGSAAIREMERFAADHDLAQPESQLPSRKPSTGKSVAIVGAGPAGLSAAYHLARQGHAVTVIDRRERAGGSLRGVSETQLPSAVLDNEIAQLERLGITFRLGTELSVEERSVGVPPAPASGQDGHSPIERSVGVPPAPESGQDGHSLIERSVGVPPSVFGLICAEDQRSVPYQPGASPQENPQNEAGLKARPISGAEQWVGPSALEVSPSKTWGAAPGWYGAAPLALSIQDLTREFDAVLLTVGEVAVPERDKLGVAASPTGIKVDPNTFQTSLPSVFAAGSAVKLAKQLIRAMADGKSAAECMYRFLLGQEIRRAEKPFSSVMGRIEPGELQVFLRGLTIGSQLASKQPPTPQDAAAEAARCLHCDCRSAGNCALQHYAQTYGADANRFRSKRAAFEQQVQPGGVIFEPGKCILCGICVKLTEMAGEPLGLTFIGRGFEVRLATPFNHTIEEGLRKVAQECVKHCPTGALAIL
ncbi:MAG: FAD-dependent oxidoreductase [Verrucomicrobiota bacterium]